MQRLHDTGGAITVQRDAENLDLLKDVQGHWMKVLLATHLPAVQALQRSMESLGIDVWFDKDRLEAGDLYDQKIRRNIRGCSFWKLPSGRCCSTRTAKQSSQTSPRHPLLCTTSTTTRRLSSGTTTRRSTNRRRVATFKREWPRTEPRQTFPNDGPTKSRAPCEITCWSFDRN